MRVGYDTPWRLSLSGPRSRSVIACAGPWACIIGVRRNLDGRRGCGPISRRRDGRRACAGDRQVPQEPSRGRAPLCGEPPAPPAWPANLDGRARRSPPFWFLPIEHAALMSALCQADAPEFQNAQAQTRMRAWWSDVTRDDVEDRSRAARLARVVAEAWDASTNHPAPLNRHRVCTLYADRYGSIGFMLVWSGALRRLHRSRGFQ